MTPLDRERRKDRRKGCYAIARQRGRLARREGRDRLVVLLIFVWALLTGPFTPWPATSLPRRDSSSVPRSSGSPEAEDWPITEYERGTGGYLMRPRHAAASGSVRYRSRPSLSRLMADLRRPAARKDAAAALEARIADPVTRAWVAERIAKNEINRLSIWVQPGRAEETVMAAWQGEADTVLIADEANIASPTPDRGSLLQVAKLLETLAGTETVTATGPKRPGDV